ncbi:MAG: septum formation initiator family protein [Dermabacter sp.]|nr:septum formation initiator family protein [Dermabacter sp.]
MAQLAPSPARRPRTAAPAPSRRPALALVARPQTQRSTLPFTILVSLILAGALVAMLLLNIAMSNTSYELTRLQGQSQSLAEQRQGLEERAETLGTPQELERRAREIGMVPAGEVAYIDLASGTIIGTAGVAESTGQALPATAPTTEGGGPAPYDYGMGNERN